MSMEDKFKEWLQKHPGELPESILAHPVTRKLAFPFVGEETKDVTMNVAGINIRLMVRDYIDKDTIIFMSKAPEMKIDWHNNYLTATLNEDSAKYAVKLRLDGL